MTTTQELPTLGPIARYEQNIIDRITDFNDPRQEWRRLFSELLGTFFLVLAAAGGGMMGHAFPGVSAARLPWWHRRSRSWPSSCSWARCPVPT